MNFLLHPRNPASISASEGDNDARTEEEREQDEMREAYDLDDPKHPDYMERLCARADYWEDR